MKIVSRSLFLYFIFTFGAAQNCHPNTINTLDSYQVNTANVECNTANSWTCSDGLTGTLCNEACIDSIQCIGQSYQSECSPPFQKECLFCKEQKLPVTINSEDQNRNRTKYADLLNGHGSFEDAKVYNDYFSAAVALEYTNTITDFNDVLFSSGWKGWSSNTLKLSNLAQIFFGKGAEESRGMLFVTQGIHLVKEIVLHNSNEARSIENEGVMKGLYYKLWIRGKNENTINLDLQVGLAEINSPTSFLQNKFVQHKYNEDMYEWKEINGYIDLLGRPGDTDQRWDFPASLYFRIDVTSRSEIMIDEICVYPSWVKNAQFQRWISTATLQPYKWDTTGADNVLDGASSAIPQLKMGSSVSNYSVSQYIDLSYFPDNVNFPLTLKIEAAYEHESAIQKIPYLQVAWVPHGGDREWVVYHKLTATEKSTVSAQVRATSQGGRLELWKHTTSSNEGDTIILSSVALYADPKSCLVDKCEDIERRGFWNFKCNPCSQTLVYPDEGKTFTECILTENGPSYKQEACPKSDTMKWGGFKQESPTVPPCTYQCPSNNWFNRVLNECEECSEYDGNACDVGSYFSDCVYGGESDSSCRICETISSHRLQYTVGVTTQPSTCDVECKPGYFQFGTDANGIPICLPCSESVCGAPDSFRHIPGYQRTTVCNGTSNSVCESCIARDEDHLIYNASATEIGADCDYVCEVGYQRCNNQETFDPRKPLTVERQSEEASLPVTFDAGPANADDDNVLWIRVSGQLQLNDLRRSYFVTIEYGSQSQRYTPVVDSYNRVLKQPFEFLVQYNGSPPVTIRGEDTTQDPTVYNLLIETQQLNGPFCTCEPCANTRPGNASWVVGSECTWECRPNFREVDGECIVCLDPACPIGKYWSDCDECLFCPPLHPNTMYVQGTNAFNDSTASCVPACESNFYRDFDGTCKECSQLSCSETEYLQECRELSDALCRICAKCLPDEIVSTPCNSTNDTICSPCSTVLPYGAHYTGISECDWDCSTPYTRIEALGDSCTECFDRCSPGFYFTGACTSDNNYTGCKPCVQIPENALFTTKGLVENMNTSCLWDCPTELPFLNHTSFRCEPIPYETSSVIANIQNRIRCTSIFYDHTHECPLGKFFNQTNDFITNPDLETCGSCVDCPEKPAHSVFRMYSCNWECKNPFFRVNNVCKLLQDVI